MSLRLFHFNSTSISLRFHFGLTSALLRLSFTSAHISYHTYVCSCRKYTMCLYSNFFKTSRKLRQAWDMRTWCGPQKHHTNTRNGLWRSNSPIGPARRRLGARNNGSHRKQPRRSKRSPQILSEALENNRSILLWTALPLDMAASELLGIRKRVQKLLLCAGQLRSKRLAQAAVLCFYCTFLRCTPCTDMHQFT